MSIPEVSLSWNLNLEHVHNSKVSKGVPALQGPQTKHRGWRTVSQGPTRNGKEGIQLPTLALEMRSPEFQPSLYCYTTAWHWMSLVTTKITHEAIINHEYSSTWLFLERGMSRGLCPQGRGWETGTFWCDGRGSGRVSWQLRTHGTEVSQISQRPPGECWVLGSDAEREEGKDAGHGGSLPADHHTEAWDLVDPIQCHGPCLSSEETESEGGKWLDPPP